MCALSTVASRILAASMRTALPSRVATMQRVRRSAMVGRDAENTVLGAALADARAGRGGLVLLQGEAGMGKSRLAGELVAGAEAERVVVLVGRATESGRPVPFRPLSEALLARFRGTPPPDSPALQPFRGALARLVPEWRDAGIPAADEPMVMIAEAVVRLLRSLGKGGGCLLVLEDVHWADPETLAVVEYLADNLAVEPVLCLATLRPEEAGPARVLANALAARRAATSLEIGHLHDAEVLDVARGCLDAPTVPDELVAPLLTWTEGVPFFIEELLTAWIASGALENHGGEWSVATQVGPVVPASFADSLQGRVDRLGEDTRNVLRAAAILGRRFEWSLVPAITGLSRTAVLRVLTDCVAARIIVDEPAQDPPAFRFRHALTRDAVDGGLLTPEREALSALAHRAVEDAHPSLDGWWCDLAADLAELSGNRGRAAQLLLMSGRRALAQGALASAEVALERARALDPSPGAAIKADATLTEVLALAGKVGPAVEVGTRLLAACSAAGSSVAKQAEYSLRLARALIAQGAWGPASLQLRVARSLADGQDEPLLGPCADVLAAQAALGQRHLFEAAALATTALERAEAAGLAEVACAAHEVLGHCARSRDIPEAEDSFTRSLQVAEVNGLTAWRTRALQELASIDALTTHRLDRVHEARGLANGSGALAAAAALDLDLCRVLAFNFDCDQALEAGRRCADTARRFRLRPLLAMAVLRQAQCHAIAGRAGEMESAIAEALADAGPDPAVTAGALGDCRATLSLLRNQSKRALDELERAASSVHVVGDLRSSTFWALWALLRTTENAEGERACAVLRSAGVIGLPFHQALLRYADAVTLGSLGRHEQAHGAFAEGEAHMATMTGRGGYGFVALRLVAERAIEDGWGDPVAWLRPTVVFFEEAGQDAAASACRLLLHEAGAPLPRRRRSDSLVPSSLRALGVTARELDVLALVGQRLPNDEIGSRLFISRRTVDKHVQHLLAKTGLADRAALRALAENTRREGSFSQ